MVPANLILQVVDFCQQVLCMKKIAIKMCKLHSMALQVFFSELDPANQRSLEKVREDVRLLTSRSLFKILALTLQAHIPVNRF